MGYPKNDQQQKLASVSHDSAPEHIAVLQAERDRILAPKVSIQLQLIQTQPPSLHTTSITHALRNFYANNALSPSRPNSKAKSRSQPTAPFLNASSLIEEPLVSEVARTTPETRNQKAHQYSSSCSHPQPRSALPNLSNGSGLQKRCETRDSRVRI